MMTVSEFSAQGGVSPNVVRFYCRIGLLTPTRHPDNGYKLFSSADIPRLRFIRRAQSLGYTLEEISEILEICGRGQSPCARVKEILRRRIEDNRHKIEELTALQNRMERAMARWAEMPDWIPPEELLCFVINAAETEEPLTCVSGTGVHRAKRLGHRDILTG